MKISVVIPATSKTKPLEVAITSVYKQMGGFELEILVIYNNVDPSSAALNTTELPAPPSTNIVLRELTLEGSHVNGNSARNYGTVNATGQYIAYLDYDDYWYENHLAERMALVESGAEAVFGPFIIDRNQRDNKRDVVPYESGDDVFDFIWARGGFAQTSGFLVAKAAALASPWDEELKRSQDHDFFVRMSQIERWAQVKTETYAVVWHAFSHRTYHFDSYWKFYTDNKTKFNDRSASGYLFSRLLEASFSNDHFFPKFKAELKARNNQLPLVRKLVVSSRLAAKTGWYINQFLN